MASVLGSWLQSSCPVAGLPSLRAAAVLGGYIVFLAVAGAILPGKVYPGTQLADGSRLHYKCNGFRLVLVTLAVLSAGVKYEIVSPTIVADMGGELFMTDLLMVFVISTLLYICGALSKSKNTSFKPHLTSNPLMDWWLGVQLNPCFLGIDIKFFWLRPSMMGWLLINLSIAAKQIEQTGTLSLSMALYQAFTGIYVLDYFWYEEYMTSTWDIIAENFGFMLCMGDMVWIPFTFSIQAWWLLKHPVELSLPAAAAIIALFLAGYTVFRGANMQKHIFKQNPKALIWGKTPRLIGGKLLVSGYWGWARKCNYLGDLILALSFSLPCGFESAIPYFYFTYLLILLIQRDRRDESKCRTKYKKVWEDYCSTVPWRILPYIY